MTWMPRSPTWPRTAFKFLGDKKPGIGPESGDEATFGHFYSPWGMLLELVSFPNGKTYMEGRDRVLWRPPRIRSAGSMMEADKLDALWSVHEIRQLAYRFAQAHDSRDMPEMERIFVGADEPLAFPDFNFANVRSTLPAYWQVAGPTMLFVTNHIVDFIDNDHATGAVYCLAKLEITGSWTEQAILYRDAYDRRDGVWLFTQRRTSSGMESSYPSAPSSSPRRNGRRGRRDGEACQKSSRPGGPSTGSRRRRAATTANRPKRQRSRE
jgi:SnoaL-like domain